MAENARILVVEDENDIRELISLHLKRAGYHVDAVATGEEAVDCFKKQHYDVYVLDWMLPELSGLEITKILRASHKNMPILMVTAKSDPAYIVAALEAGADDYVTKPFDLTVLLVRVRALLRRSARLSPPVAATASTQPQLVRLGDLTLNAETHEVKCQGSLIPLTISEFKLLFVLGQHQGKVFTRDRLIHEIQGEGIAVVDRTIDTHVFGLRKKLGPCADVIETVRGVGYRVKAND